MSCSPNVVTADKLVFVGGDKLTTLLGKKGGTSLTGTIDKSISLNGEKGGANFIVTSDKTVYLSGEKIVYLSGSTDKTTSLIGSKDATFSLQADGACVGWWYILVDSTLYTVDNTFVTVDRTPV
jgi:hypothetical protein